jgi:hypothetical protein
MSAPFVVPFDFNPNNITTLKTATNYTVPAGQYARLVVGSSACERTQTTSLNSNATAITETDVPNINGNIIICNQVEYRLVFQRGSQVFPLTQTGSLNLGQVFSARDIFFTYSQTVVTGSVTSKSVLARGISNQTIRTLTDTGFMTDTTVRSFLLSFETAAFTEATGNFNLGFQVDRGQNANSYWLRTGEVINLPSGARCDLRVERYNEKT